MGSLSPRNRVRTARAPRARCAPPPPTPPPRAIGAPPRHHRFSGRRASVGSSGSSPRASPVDPSPRLQFRKAQLGHLEARALSSSNSSRSKFRPHSITRPVPKKPSRRSSDTKNRKHSVRPSALAYATAWNIARIISCWLGFFFLEAGRKLSRAGDSAGAARVGGRSSSLPTPSSSIVS